MTLPNYLAPAILAYLIIESTLIAVNYNNNTRTNLGTTFEGGTFYEADY